MKKVLLATSFFMGGSLLLAQLTNDEVILEAGYAKEKWYSMENGVVGEGEAKDWDLAFDLKPQDASIRINDGNGIRLYEYPGGFDKWDEVDTAGMESWQALYNSNSEWRTGAFNQLKDPDSNNPMFDYGWANYEQTSHNVVGYRIFVIKLMDNSFKKIAVSNMIGADGIYYFSYADIDGTNEVQDSIVKSEYVNKQFAYYSIQNGTALDHEAVEKTDWDLFFGKYVSEVEYMGNFVPSGVAGVLANEKVKVAKVENINVQNYTDWSEQTFSSNIGAIGWEWEGYDMQTHSYNVQDSLLFFVKAQSGDVWKIFFTGFEGASTGKFEFTKELISAASLSANDLNNKIFVYPNPASDNVSILLNDLNNKETTIQILNANSQVLFDTSVLEKNDFEMKNISISHLNRGVYFIKIQNGNHEVIKKLVKI